MASDKGQKPVNRKRQSLKECGGQLSKGRGPEMGTHQPVLGSERGLVQLGLGEKGEGRRREVGAGAR